MAKILMIAPQPFFRPRGTPFSVLHRIRALIKLGHEVDLVTYPFGDDPGLEGLTIRRSRGFPGVQDVGIGPSVAKLLLDLPLFAEARRMTEAGGYDLIHTHEEGGFLGALLTKRYGVPHVWDLHSSLPQQFENFQRFDWPLVVAAFEKLETFALRRSVGVITVYRELESRILASGFQGPVILLENTLDLERETPSPERIEALRTQLAPAGERLVLYTGTLEPYQGLELLVDSGPVIAARTPGVRIVSVGGTRVQIEVLEERARKLGVGELFSFIPTVPPAEVFDYHAAADALITTRVRGMNTPLKIYQYLRSGKPIIATAIRSHTQVLSEEVAELVPTTPEGIAQGIQRVLSNPLQADSMVRAAGELQRQRYSEDAYLQTLESFMAEVLPATSAPRTVH